MFTARAELLDKGETTMEHTKNRQEEAGKLDQDKSNNHPTQGGLFGGLFRPKAPPLKPVIDIDDGVMRCPYCSWELEEGEHCAGCGYRYRPGSETDETESSDESESGSDLDSLDDMDDEEPEEPEDDFGDVDDNDGVWGEFASRYPTNGPTFGMPPLPGFIDYYRQFEGMSEEEVNAGLREEAAERRRKALTRVDTLDLSQTTWPELPHPRIVNAITFVARRGLQRYPHMRGSELRDELAASLRRRPRRADPRQRRGRAAERRDARADRARPAAVDALAVLPAVSRSWRAARTAAPCRHRRRRRAARGRGRARRRA